MGRHTFWDYIQDFFNSTNGLVLTGNAFVKYRLRDLFGRESFPIFRTREPSEKDCRLCLATINGESKKVWVFDFDDQFDWFWYLDPDNQPKYCQRIGLTEEFTSISEAVWEDNG